MVTSKTVLNIQQNIKIGDKTLEEVDKLKYLGSTITNDVNCKNEVKTRIAVGTSALTKLNPVLKNSNNTLKINIHLLRSVVWATTLYACESWTLHSITEKKISAFEIKCYRKILNVSYKEHRTNDCIAKEIVERTGNHETLLLVVMQRSRHPSSRHFPPGKRDNAWQNTK